MFTVIFRGFALALFALAAGRAIGSPLAEIAQAGPHNEMTIRAVGPKNRWVGFDALSDGRRFASVRFTSFGLITSGKVTAKQDGGQPALCFEDLRAEPNCGLTLERSRVEVHLAAGQFPVVRFEIHVRAFDAAVWRKTLGQVPLHFLTLTLPGASQWHQGGVLFSVNPSDPAPGARRLTPLPNWSDPISLADSPLPVIGLWNPKAGTYTAWDFLPTRLRDNSERDIRTAFCRSLIPPPAPSDLLPPAAPGHRTRPGKLFFPPPKTLIAPPKLARQYLTDQSAGRFVALVLPSASSDGETLESEMRLVCNAKFFSLDAPNRFLFQCWADNPEIAPLLPLAPAQNLWPALTAAHCPQTLAETQPLETDPINALLQSYLADKNSLANHARALAALELARNRVYRSLIFTVGDSDRRDDTDPSFRWQSDPTANLDALAAVAAQTGDPILLWALRGSLANLNQPETAQNKAPLKFRRIAPVLGTDVRILAGDKTALAFSRSGNVTLTDYRCDGSGNFAVTIRTDKAKLAATVTFPGANLSDKPVYLLRNRIIKKPLRDASQIRRDPAAPDTLLIFGLRDRDRLQIGDLALNADEPPPIPNRVSNDATNEETTGNYQTVTLSNSKTPPVGLRWLGGIPFYNTAEPVPQNRDLPTPLPREISEAREIYVLYAPAADKDSAALPLLTLDDGGVAPPTDAAPRTVAASDNPSLQIAAYHLPANRRIIALDAGRLRVFAVTILRASKK